MRLFAAALLAALAMGGGGAEQPQASRKRLHPRTPKLVCLLGVMPVCFVRLYVSFTNGLISIQKSDTTYQFPLFLEQKQYFKAQISGVTLTTLAFEKELGLLGRIFLTIAALTFALSTMFGYSYYGRKCTSYLFGTNGKCCCT